MIDPTLMDPNNDFGFKKLFADGPDLLSALINAVRPDETPIANATLFVRGGAGAMAVRQFPRNLIPKNRSLP